MPKLFMAEPKKTGVCLPSRKSLILKGFVVPEISSISSRASLASVHLAHHQA